MRSGFFYSRYAEPVEGEELTGDQRKPKAVFSRMGEDQSKDQLIIERPDHPKWGFSPEVTDDGRYLVVQNWKGSEPKAQIFVKDLRQPDAKVQELITGFDAEYEWVASVDDTLYFVTDHEAPKRRLIAVDVNNPARDAWREVIAETDDVLESVSLFGETFYAVWLKDARSKVTRHTIDGTETDELKLPGVGSVGRLRRTARRRRDLFQFHQLHHTDVDLSCRLGIGGSLAVAAARGRFRRRRLRHRATVLPEQRRNPGADHRHAAQRHQAGWQQSHAVVRLRRIQHFDHAIVFTGQRGLGRQRRRVRGRQPARRRRIRTPVARRRHAAEETKCV